MACMGALWTSVENHVQTAILFRGALIVQNTEFKIGLFQNGTKNRIFVHQITLYIGSTESDSKLETHRGQKSSSIV